MAVGTLFRGREHDTPAHRRSNDSFNSSILPASLITLRSRKLQRIDHRPNSPPMLFKGASGGRAVRLLQGVNALPLRVKAADLASRSLAAASIRVNGQSSSPLANSHPAIAYPSLLLYRQFADRAVSRPKAHTGRSTSPLKTSTTKKRTTKTTKIKTIAKPKPKKKAKKTLTPEEKQKQEIRKLKKEILTPPKDLPATAWTVLFTEQAKDVPGRVDATAAAAKYRNLSPSEREVCCAITYLRLLPANRP
jgi:hypothetical protein